MYVLFETQAGYALFKVLKDSKLKDTEGLYKEFETPGKAAKFLKLKAFKKFKDTKDAMKAVERLLKSDLPKGLKKFLDKNIVQKGIEE